MMSACSFVHGVDVSLTDTLDGQRDEVEETTQAKTIKQLDASLRKASGRRSEIAGSRSLCWLCGFVPASHGAPCTVEFGGVESGTQAPRHLGTQVALPLWDEMWRSMNVAEDGMTKPMPSPVFRKFQRKNEDKSFGLRKIHYPGTYC